SKEEFYKVISNPDYSKRYPEQVVELLKNYGCKNKMLVPSCKVGKMFKETRSLITEKINLNNREKRAFRSFFGTKPS
ncbi:hypothetical protein ACFLY6_03330, partial [Candidatus Dependentiae bacterium]